jgi:hypothetical protein
VLLILNLKTYKANQSEPSVLRFAGTFSGSTSVNPPADVAGGIGCFDAATGRPGVGAVGRGAGPEGGAGFRLPAP